MPPVHTGQPIYSWQTWDFAVNEPWTLIYLNSLESLGHTLYQDLVSLSLLEYGFAVSNPPSAVLNWQLPIWA